MVPIRSHGVDPIYDSFSPGCVFASGLTKRRLVRSVLFALSVAVGITPELLSDGGQRQVWQKASFDGKETDNRKNINAMVSFGSMDVLCVDKQEH